MRFSPRLRLSSESLSIAESAEVPMKLGLSVSSQLRQQLQVPHYPAKLSLLARSETTQNPGFAVKLNQELPSHLFCHRNVPAECFDAATSLPYPYPFVSDAQDFGHSNGEPWGAIPFSKRFEQKQLFFEIAPHESQREHCIRTNRQGVSSQHRFYRPNELLPEFLDTLDGHRQTDGLSLSSKAKKQFPKVYYTSITLV
jgi:hypothetical protein